MTVCYYHVYLNFSNEFRLPTFRDLWKIIQYLKSKNMKKLFTLKYTNTKVLSRKQLRSVVGSGIPMAMLMCKSSVEGEAPTLISFQGCDDAGQFKDRSGIFCKRGDAMYVKTC